MNSDEPSLVVNMIMKKTDTMMEVKITYSSIQLEATVKFIAKNNEHFLGKNKYIREEILNHMKRIALSPHEWLGGTMGYTLWGDRENEGFDCDENTIRFDISVDPALGLSEYAPEEYIDEVVSGEPESDK
jgi:hypothetical protein